jgi:hypothetical protein
MKILMKSQFAGLNALPITFTARYFSLYNVIRRNTILGCKLAVFSICVIFAFFLWRATLSGRPILLKIPGLPALPRRPTHPTCPDPIPLGTPPSSPNFNRIFWRAFSAKETDILDWWLSAPPRSESGAIFDSPRQCLIIGSALTVTNCTPNIFRVHYYYCCCCATAWDARRLAEHKSDPYVLEWLRLERASRDERRSVIILSPFGQLCNRLRILVSGVFWGMLLNRSISINFDDSSGSWRSFSN